MRTKVPGAYWIKWLIAVLTSVASILSYDNPTQQVIHLRGIIHTQSNTYSARDSNPQPSDPKSDASAKLGYRSMGGLFYRLERLAAHLTLVPGNDTALRCFRVVLNGSSLQAKVPGLTVFRGRIYARSVGGSPQPHTLKHEEGVGFEPTEVLPSLP